MQRRRIGLGLWAGFAAAMLSPLAAHAEAGVGVQHRTLIDTARTVKAAKGYPGAAVRRIDVTIWYPADIARGADDATPSAGAHPLVIYSHGSYGQADNAMYLVRDLVRAGYVVAAPDYPLSSRAAYTKITGADTTDVANQARDIHLIIDRLLADPALSPVIDPVRIATAGHSLGAVTSYFASYGSGIADPRIKAAVLMGAGDPVQAALSANMGMTGVWHMPVRLPVLFMSAEHDVFARFTGRPHVAYTRVEGPKVEITVQGGAHVWFTDAAGLPSGGTNPDCASLGGGTGLPGCEKGLMMTTAERQHQITATAVIAFLDGYLKGDGNQLARLRNLGRTMPDIDERAED